MIHSLCETCRYRREIVSGKGGRFVLCEKSLADRRFPKYPPQPIQQCQGYEQARTADDRSA